MYGLEEIKAMNEKVSNNEFKAINTDTRKAEILARIKKEGPEVIQAEIQSFWAEIMLRNEVLTKYYATPVTMDDAPEKADLPRPAFD